jgi:hypothetical protein
MITDRDVSRRMLGGYRVSSQIQFTSHALPPSSENDCSIRADVGDRSSQTYRTRMVLPFHSCWLKNSPRFPVNWPMTGGKSMVPLSTSTRWMRHWRESAL